ncbi:MAG: NFACT RNA binding domain-containing protein [Nitrospirota bacterium]|nr:NFACT RNA binding domain-containing protein [Nitrospirota bacterium]
MSVAEIARAVDAVNRLATGGVVVKVRRPLPDHLALTVRHRGRNVDVVAGVVAGLARFHVAGDLPPTPPDPGPFALRARSLMRPSRLVSVSIPGNGRVVEVTVSRHGEGESEWQATLVLELFRQGRMVLLDDRRRVLAWYGPGGARGLVTGQPYRPPEAPEETEAGAFGSSASPLEGAALEACYAHWIAAHAEQEVRTEVSRRLKRQCARTARRLANMEGDLARLQGWEEVGREGELLSGHRHLLKRGMAQVTVTDWFTDGCPQRVIALAPDKTPEENIAVRFARVRKARRGLPQLTRRIAEARVEVARLAAARDELAAGGVPWEVLERVGVAAAPVAEKPSRGGGSGVRTFMASDGRQIWVGRSGAENDRLTFRMANGKDLWLHARDVQGAHVVLHGRGADSGAALMEAAQLAAHFSRLKQEGGGEVIYTPRKYVRRPKGGKPGQTLVTGEKVLQVRLDPELVARVLARRA